MKYKEFIQNIIDTRGQWNIPDNKYYEVHHIIPKCMGGLPKSHKHRTKHENLIWLYPEEHFIAHKLLAEENPDNAALINAWCMMAFPKGKAHREFEISSEEYAEIRKKWSESLRGKKRSEELKEKLHQNCLVNDNYGMKGKHHSEEFKQRQRERMLKDNPATRDNVREKLRLLRVAHPTDNSAWIEKIKDAASRPETRKKKSESRKGKKLYTDGIESHMFKPGTEPDGYHLVIKSMKK